MLKHSRWFIALIEEAEKLWPHTIVTLLGLSCRRLLSP